VSPRAQRAEGASASKAGTKPRRGGRVARFRQKARANPLATLLVANILPIIVVLCLGIAYANGSITFKPRASSVIPSLIFLVGSLVVLAVLAWIVAPLIVPAVRATSAFINRQTATMAEGGVLSFVGRFPLLVGGMILYAILWVNSFLVALLIAIDILAILAGLGLFIADVWRAQS
jgi:hypothetical protein